MADLRAAGCELLTITQYLRPSPRHHPVARWVEPAEFDRLREEALGLGFAGVMSGRLVGPPTAPGGCIPRRWQAGPRPVRTPLRRAVTG